MRYVWYALAVAGGVALGALGASILNVSPRPSLLPALVGIGGVAVGAGLAILGQVLVYRLRRSDDERRSELERRAALRRAARLVEADLMTVSGALTAATDKDDPTPMALSVVPGADLLDSWREYRDILAGGVSDYVDWLEIAHGISSGSLRPSQGSSG